MPINYDQSGVVYDSTVYNWDGDVRAQTVYPIVGVFIAFDDTPYTASPGWVEITPYVRSVSTHRGRSNDLEQFDTGTAQLVLDNRDRRFDPFYTSGPYYTKLTPRRQIRIVGQANGANYDVFRGYVAGWPVTWSDAGKDSTVTIQAFDALGLMANETVPTDWPYFYITSLNPIHYWKFNDSRTSGKVLDRPASGEPDLSMTDFLGTPLFETPALADGNVGNGIYIDYGVDTLGSIFTYPSGNRDLSLVFWASNPNTVTGTNTQVYFYSRQNRIEFTWASGGGFTISVVNSGYYRTYTYAIAIRNQPVHIAICSNMQSGSTNPTMTLYVNGSSVATVVSASGAGGATTQEYAQAIKGTWQEMAVFASELTAAQVTSIYNAGSARFSETTTARMNRLIATTDYPTALTSFTASPVATVAEIGSGANVIPEMQLVADSEGGEIYVDKSGILTTTNRTDVFNATRSATSQATITDNGTGLKYGTELNIQYDADNLKNDVTVNYSGGGQVEVYNDATISGYGAASTVIETQLADPISATNLALMELGVEGSLIPQISPIDLSPNTAAADWQTILGLELLDRVTFKRTPTVGNQFNRDALVNAIDHQIAPGVWNTQVTLSMRYTSPLTLDDDILGTLDLNYLG